MKELLKGIIRDFHKGSLPLVRSRFFKVPLDTGKVVTLVGVRRSGKSFLMFDTVKRLLDRGTSKERIVYVNFEDERLELHQESLGLILDAYSELYPEVPLSECYLFFDEIQNVDGWDRFVRRVYDGVTKNIFITGSNAKLLSREISTALRGRTLSYEVFPLSFGEYLSFKDVEVDLYHSGSRAKIYSAFEEFLSEGGFPELVFISDASVRRRVLQEYFNVMLYRDIIERFGVRNVLVLKYFLKRVFEGVTSPLSINKIYNELRSQGYKVGRDTLYTFLEAAEAVFMVLKVERYDPSVLKRELSAKKLYVVDNGLLNAVTVRFSKDLGKLLENLVLVELYKKGYNSVFFYTNRGECDFVVKDDVGGREMVLQVCWDLSYRDTMRREVEGLKRAGSRLGITSGYLITSHMEEIIVEDGFTVHVVPACKFLLQLPAAGEA